MNPSLDNVNHKSRASADQVLELVHAVMHQVRASQFHAVRDGPHSITPMEVKVLAFFGRHPGATQSDLSQHSGRDKAQLARLIKGLRERGLLHGQADEDDRRNCRLALTDQGLAMQQAMAQQTRRLAAQAVAGMSLQERQQLSALLERVHHNLAPAPQG